MRQASWRAIDGISRTLGLVSFRRNTKQLPRALQALLIEPLPPIPLMRTGHLGDGGYWIPRELDHVSFVLSAGIGGEWSFEQDLSVLYPSISVLGIDPDDQPGYPFTHHRGFLGAHVDESTSTIPTLLPNVVDGLIIKIDIEGGEYAAILATPDSILDACDVLVMELHELNRLLDPSWANFILTPFATKLLRTHVPIWRNPNANDFCFHLAHECIPKTMEVTLVRRSLLSSQVVDLPK